MTDSLALGPDAQLNHLLAVLRHADSAGEIAQPLAWMPGMDLRADPALDVRGRYRSPVGRLLELDIDLNDNPAPERSFLAIHMALGARDLTGFGLFGIAARTSAPQIELIQPCLRSGLDDGFVDCFFDKHILSRPDEASHLDALAVGQRTDLPAMAPWRELILFLPVRSFTWSLLDLRLFVV